MGKFQGPVSSYRGVGAATNAHFEALHLNLESQAMHLNKMCPVKPAKCQQDARTGAGEGGGAAPLKNPERQQ